MFDLSFLPSVESSADILLLPSRRRAMISFKLAAFSTPVLFSVSQEKSWALGTKMDSHIRPDLLQVPLLKQLEKYFQRTGKSKV